MMHCSTFNELLPRYLREEMDEPTRAAWREHLRSCAACRARAVAEEPALLLSLARPARSDELPSEIRLAAALAEVRSRRLERRLAARRWRRLAAAAALVVAGGLGGVVLAPHHPPQSVVQTARQETVPEPAAVPPAVEVEMDSEVTVYQLTADDGDTAVTFVVNPGMRL